MSLRLQKLCRSIFPDGYMFPHENTNQKINPQAKTVKDVLDPEDNLGAVGMAFVLVLKRHLPMQTSTLGSSATTSVLSAR